MQGTDSRNLAGAPSAPAVQGLPLPSAVQPPTETLRLMKHPNLSAKQGPGNPTLNPSLYN